MESLADRPSKAKAIKLLQSGKAPGEDGIPAEIYKHGGEAIISHLFSLFGYIGTNEDIPQELKYAIIVTKKSDCGITTGELLSVIIKSLLSKSHNRLATLQIPNYL